MISAADAGTRYLPAAVAMTRDVARTFALATRFLPSGVRSDVYLLYLVCRSLDDLVDTRHPEAEERLRNVQAWTEGATHAPQPEIEILAHLFWRYPDMPRDAVVHFCYGQLADLGSVRVQTEAELDEHCYRVAGTVGRLMAGLLGVEGPDADGAARALGIAMQRTNILRDIDEDLLADRIYIPSETMRACGVTNLRYGDRTALLEVEIAAADRWYGAGLGGVRRLRRGRWQVRWASMMYREILRQIEREGLGRVRPSRVSVGSSRKLGLIFRAWMAGITS